MDATISNVRRASTCHLFQQRTCQAGNTTVEFAMVLLKLSSYRMAQSPISCNTS
jgi:hypothetical protein